MLPVPTNATHVHVRFISESAAPHTDSSISTKIARFVNPLPFLAVAQAHAPDDLPDVGTEVIDRFDVLFIPAGSATPFEEQKRAEAWMVKSADLAAEPTIELLLRSDRILWRPGRALVQGAPERFNELLAGLVDFAFHEGELRKLERELDCNWPTYEADIRLTHAVGDADLEARDHVNEMTYAATRRRMVFARLERPLEKASITLPGPARRLVSELLVQAEVLERMRSVDDRIEVYEDLYELANDRLCEYLYFSTELRIERWIFVVLALELILVAWEVILQLQET